LLIPSYGGLWISLIWGSNRSSGISDEPEAKPYKFDDGDNAEADAEAKETSDVREEVNPTLTGLSSKLHHGDGVKVNVQNGNVFIIGIVLAIKCSKNIVH